MRIDTTCICQLVASDGGVLLDEEVERIIDSVMDELQSLGFEDAVIGGSVATRVFEIFIPCAGETFMEVADRIDSGIRSAFHAAGVCTPEWQGPQDLPVRMERREVTFKDPEADGQLTSV